MLRGDVGHEQGMAFIFPPGFTLYETLVNIFITHDFFYDIS